LCHALRETEYSAQRVMIRTVIMWPAATPSKPSPAEGEDRSQ
jgi:hypothetical protein